MAAVVIPAGRGDELAKVAVPVPMRGVVEGLITPSPISQELPALLQEDDFCVRLTQAFDDVVAPVYAVLDCWPSYLDPHIAPADFVDWIASWVGVEIDENWPLERRRRLVELVVDLYRMRGTVAGLSAHIELYAGVAPEILENGGCLWSQTAETPLPGSADHHIGVRLYVPDPTAINRTTVERIVAASRPAHLHYNVDIVTAEGRVIEAPEDATTEGQTADDAPGAVDLPGSERIEMAPPGPESHEVEEGSELDAPDGKEPSE
jgi:phage tail-like protein